MIVSQLDKKREALSGNLLKAFETCFSAKSKSVVEGTRLADFRAWPLCDSEDDVRSSFGGQGVEVITNHFRHVLEGGWVNQAYSRLSTTHGHITNCKLDSVVYVGVCVVI